MSFVPGFKHDVFVSYAHVDNLSYSGDASTGWVHTLVDNLRVPLSQTLGHSARGEIWLDRKLRGNEPFPDDIRSAVESSATLLVVLSKGYEGLQLDLAQASGMPILRWRDPDLAIDTVSDPELFGREEMLVMPFEEFKQEIIRRVEATTRRPAPAPAPVEGETYVAISADENDGPAAESVMRILEQRTIGYEQVRGEELRDLVEDEDLGYNAVIVVYDRCEPVWAAEQVRECRRIVMRKKSRAPVCGVYVGEAGAHAPLQIRPPRFHFFSRPDDEPFSSFVGELEARAGPEAAG